MNTSYPKFLKSLFWEFDLSELDIKNHRYFIVERILEKGKIDSIKWLFENFSMAEIRNVIESSRNLTSRTRNFWFEYLKYATYTT